MCAISQNFYAMEEKATKNNYILSISWIEEKLFFIKLFNYYREMEFLFDRRRLTITV